MKAMLDGDLEGLLDCDFNLEGPIICPRTLYYSRLLSVHLSITTTAILNEEFIMELCPK
jgi:hypothetical protein